MDALRREEQAAADKKADEERKYKLELAKMEMEEKRYEREAAAAAALVAAESKKGNQFSFEVPEDADMTNPIFAFSKCMATFQAQFATILKKNQELEDANKEKDEQIAQLKASVE